MKVTHAMDFVLSKLEHGYYTFSLKEAENTLGAGEKTWKALNRLVKQGWLFSPSKGFYVIIDPQHQGKGFLPIEWFIDDWMKYLGGQYYLGILTAAMFHGASHQKPQQIQIVRDRVFGDIDKGSYHISFFYKKHIPTNCCEQRQSPAGYFRISTPETTAYDLLRYPRACPSLNLAATIMSELGENIHPDRLAELIDTGGQIAVLQRLGWMLEHVGWAEKTGMLAGKLRQHYLAWRPIRTDLPKDGPHDARWHIIANTEIEADL